MDSCVDANCWGSTFFWMMYVYTDGDIFFACIPFHGRCPSLELSQNVANDSLIVFGQSQLFYALARKIVV